MWRLGIALLLVSLSGCQRLDQPLDAERWQQYRARFISPEGRVIDNGNGGISHSEGQGYAMLLAVAAGDRATFDRLWRWTDANLAQRPDGLLVWRWSPAGENHTPDRNNATDGDLLIAWALGRAAHRFDEPAYGRRAAALAAALRQHLSRTTPFGPQLLPGAEGFESGRGMAINPSYFIFPAYRELARWDDAVYWQRLRQSSERLLQAALNRFHGLPPDWLFLSGDAMAAAPHAPLRFGFDALRVPLYACWDADARRLPLQAIAAQWQRDAAPAWVALDSAEQAAIPLTPAHRAVRWLLTRCLTQAAQQPAALPPLADDYYGATLALLVELAWNETQ